MVVPAALRITIALVRGVEDFEILSFQHHAALPEKTLLGAKFSKARGLWSAPTTRTRLKCLRSCEKLCKLDFTGISFFEESEARQSIERLQNINLTRSQTYTALSQPEAYGPIEAEPEGQQHQPGEQQQQQQRQQKQHQHQPEEEEQQQGGEVQSPLSSYVDSPDKNNEIEEDEDDEEYVVQSDEDYVCAPADLPLRKGGKRSPAAMLRRKAAKMRKRDHNDKHRAADVREGLVERAAAAVATERRKREDSVKVVRKMFAHKVKVVAGKARQAEKAKAKAHLDERRKVPKLKAHYVDRHKNQKPNMQAARHSVGAAIRKKGARKQKGNR